MNRSPAGLLVLAVAAALLLAACGGGGGAPRGSAAATASPSATVTAVPGVSAERVTVVAHAPLTGTAHPGYAEIAPAAAAYFRYLNAHGGVAGRQVDFRYADDKGTAAGAKSALDGLLPSAFAVVGAFGEEHRSVAAELAAKGVPDLFVASGCACVLDPAALPLAYAFPPSDQDRAAVLAAYVRAHFPNKRVGVLYENDELGNAGLRGVRSQIPAALLVDVEDYASSTNSITAQVAALRAKGAQVVINLGLPTFTATLALLAHDLGWHPQLVAPGADPTTLGMLVEDQSRGDEGSPGRSVLDGLITDSFLPSPDDAADPWIALFRRIHDADADIARSSFDANTVYGMSLAYTFAQALAAAGPEPTRASLLAAVRSTTFSATGPGLVALHYGASQHTGFAGIRLGRVVGGVLTLAAPVYAVSGTRVVTVPAVARRVPPAG